VTANITNITSAANATI